MTPLKATTLCVMIVLFVMAATTRVPKEVVKQRDWTDEEITCADLVGITEHGDQYTRREALRMCRVYIKVNGGFGSDGL